MVIGVPKEIKADEYRVSVVPAGVEVLTKAGHEVLVEAGAGLGTSISDAEYEEHGARIVPTAADVWSSQLICKVKEPLEPEFPLIRPDHVFFTYLHLAADQNLTRTLLERRATCIAYETIQEPDGSLPLLTPMSEVAGRMAIQEGAKYLERPQEGRGILLSGVPGVAPANIVIIGGGIVGTNAAKIAAGIGAQVTILDVNLDRLRYLDDVLPPNVMELYSNAYNLRKMLAQADLLIGAVLVRGDKAPVLVTREMLGLMKPGAVIVDVAVDQGGCVETIRPTTHSKPTYIVDGIVHYAVANMPGAVAGTSTYALTNVTLPYLKQLADKGWQRACRENAILAKGLNLVNGHTVFQPVASLFGLPYQPVGDLLMEIAA